MINQVATLRLVGFLRHVLSRTVALDQSLKFDFARVKLRISKGDVAMFLVGPHRALAMQRCDL